MAELTHIGESESHEKTHAGNINFCVTRNYASEKMLKRTKYLDSSAKRINYF